MSAKPLTAIQTEQLWGFLQGRMLVSSGLAAEAYFDIWAYLTLLVEGE
jgi:hypothetical protein